MKTMKYILILAAITATTSHPTHAQEAKEEQSLLASLQMEPIRVVNLSFISAGHLTEAMQQLDLPVSIAAVNEQQIMIRGHAKLVDYVIASVVKVLDIPDTNRAITKTTVLPVSANSTSKANLLAMIDVAVTPSPFTRIAYDPNSQSLVVRAPSSDIKNIQVVLDRLAKPSRALLVECFFIRANLGTGGDKNESRLPKHLASVGSALASNGLTNLELLAPMMVHSQEGQGFETKATFNEKIPHDNEHSGVMDFHIRGNVKLSADKQVAEVTIKAVVHGGFSNESTHQGRTGFEVETSVATPIGDYAILAAAPSSTAFGDVIALVIRVTTK